MMPKPSTTRRHSHRLNKYSELCRHNPPSIYHSHSLLSTMSHGGPEGSVHHKERKHIQILTLPAEMQCLAKKTCSKWKKGEIQANARTIVQIATF